MGGLTTFCITHVIISSCHVHYIPVVGGIKEKRIIIGPICTPPPEGKLKVLRRCYEERIIISAVCRGDTRGRR